MIIIIWEFQDACKGRCFENRWLRQWMHDDYFSYYLTQKKSFYHPISPKNLQNWELKFSFQLEIPQEMGSSAACCKSI